MRRPLGCSTGAGGGGSGGWELRPCAPPVTDIDLFGLAREDERERSPFAWRASSLLRPFGVWTAGLGFSACLADFTFLLISIGVWLTAG